MPEAPTPDPAARKLAERHEQFRAKHDAIRAECARQSRVAVQMRDTAVEIRKRVRQLRTPGW